MASSVGFHEAEERLRPATRDRHRATVSLQEELEALDWYDQRIDAADDEALKAILAHHRDEEKEHAAMLLEWLRRHDPSLDHHLRTHLFQIGSIMGREAGEREDADGGRIHAADGSLGIGSLRGRDDR